MYNRYIRDQQGDFQIAQDASAAPPPHEAPPTPDPSARVSDAPPPSSLQQLLGGLGIGPLDTGDLLLLLILFLLFNDSEHGSRDSELLLALGLLLIL